MKIAHFIPVLTKGGAERVVIELANAAAARGDTVSIVAWTPAPPELGTNDLRPEVGIRYLDARGGSRRRAYVRILPWVLRNRDWLLGHDVVHCHLSMGSVFGAAVQMIRRLHRRKLPVVVETYHAVGTAIPAAKRAAHARLLSRRDAVAFMADDHYWASYRAARPGRLFSIIPNGVSAPATISQAQSHRYRKRAGIPDDAVVLGSVGRLMPERRPELLLDVFAHMSALTDRKIHFLLAGSGPMMTQLNEIARRHDLADRVHLPGLVLNPAEAFSNINLYLAANVGSMTGIAAIEAALAGLPVVAMQLLPGYSVTATDWIWSSTEPAEVAAKAVDLLNHPSKLKSLAKRQAGFARAHHGVHSMSENYYCLYKRCLGP